MTLQGVRRTFRLALLLVFSPLAGAGGRSLTHAPSTATIALHPVLVVLFAIVLVALLGTVLYLWKRSPGNQASQTKRESAAAETAMQMDFIQQNEDFSFSIPEIIPVGVFRADAMGKLIRGNAAMLHIFGYDSTEELRTAPPHKVLKLPNQREEILKRLRESREAFRIETGALHKSGREIWIKIFFQPVFGKNGQLQFVDGIVEDITPRKQAEFRQKETEQRYQLLTDMSPTGIYLTDPDGQIIFANEQWARLSGISTEEAMGCGWEKAIYPRDLEALRESWFSSVRNCRNWSGEYRYQHADGSIVWVWGEARPLLDDNEELLGYIGSNTDISRIKEAESAIGYSEAKYRAVVQSAALGIASLDDGGHILSVNPAFTEITGFDESAMLQRGFQSFLQPEHRETFNSRLADLIDGTLKSRAQMTLNLCRADGSVRNMSVTLSKPSDTHIEGQEQIIAVVEDITERLLLEEEISHAEKLESVGLLAGGIAHDFNNILTGIIGNLSLAEMSAEQGSELYELITEAEQSALRAQKLTKRLLTFSKGGTPVTKTMPIDEVVQEAALFALHGSDVKCEFRIEPDLEYVNIDEGQFVQVIHNLVINADQAMPKGGTIRIDLSNLRIEDESESGVQPGDYVKIDIADEGVGIPADYLPKVFDPFFSTKDTGSGLGLSTSYSIIKKHNGQIRATSSIGRGSTFSIYLPVARNAAPIESVEPKKTSECGKILIMDDEQTVRDVTRLSLQKLGFEVVEAVNCEEAIREYQREIDSGGEFKAVLLDLTIPGSRGGEATLHELKAIDPDVRAIVMSGYSNDPVLSEYRDHGFCGMISKPFGYRELSEVISLAVSDRTEGKHA